MTIISLKVEKRNLKTYKKPTNSGWQFQQIWIHSFYHF